MSTFHGAQMTACQIKYAVVELYEIDDNGVRLDYRPRDFSAHFAGPSLMNAVSETLFHTLCPRPFEGVTFADFKRHVSFTPESCEYVVDVLMSDVCDVDDLGETLANTLSQGETSGENDADFLHLSVDGKKTMRIMRSSTVVAGVDYYY